MKKIYFAGSIRGGRDDAALYRRLIRHMANYGRVLTEHIGAENLEALEAHQTDRDIYLQDTGWLREADVVIAECTRPSLGVGYELAFAEAHGREVHILYRPAESRLSAMLTGDSFFRIHPYRDEAEALALLDGILGGPADPQGV